MAQRDFFYDASAAHRVIFSWRKQKQINWIMPSRCQVPKEQKKPHSRAPRFGERKKSADGPSTAAAAAASSSVAFF
jgi:hypothetical protein